MSIRITIFLTLPLDFIYYGNMHDHSVYSAFSGNLSTRQNPAFFEKLHGNDE